jgi:queuine tRNA-ribosyltransferase
VVAAAGGLHSFANRDRTKPIITDSGGFQIFSHQAGAMGLPEAAGLKGAGSKKRPNLVLKVDEEGVVFRSYIDGKKVTLSPERSVEVQKMLGADIIIPLDEVLPFSATREKMLASFERTHRWELRSLIAHLESVQNQAMYSVVHGGLDLDLRRQSIQFLKSLPFDGMCIGGSLGKTTDDLVALLEAIAPDLPREIPTHLLGIADVPSVTAAAGLGLDTFDSCYPTRLARYGARFAAEIYTRDATFLTSSHCKLRPNTVGMARLWCMVEPR